MTLVRHPAVTEPVLVSRGLVARRFSKPSRLCDLGVRACCTLGLQSPRIDFRRVFQYGGCAQVLLAPRVTGECD